MNIFVILTIFSNHTLFGRLLCDVTLEQKEERIILSGLEVNRSVVLNVEDTHVFRTIFNGCMGSNNKYYDWRSFIIINRTESIYDRMNPKTLLYKKVDFFITTSKFEIVRNSIIVLLFVLVKFFSFDYCFLLSFYACCVLLQSSMKFNRIASCHPLKSTIPLSGELGNRNSMSNSEYANGTSLEGDATDIITFKVQNDPLEILNSSENIEVAIQSIPCKHSNNTQFCG